MNKYLEKIKAVLIHEISHKHFADCLYDNFIFEIGDETFEEHLDILTYFKDYRNIIKESGWKYVQKIMELYKNNSHDS